MFSDVLLTVDFDRTLTGPDAVVPRRNLDAIRYFMDNGGSFTVNTGRSLNTFRAHMDAVPTNAPLLLFNGAARYFRGSYTYLETIDLDMWQVLQQVITDFPQMNLEIQGLETHFLVDPKPEFVQMYEGMGWEYTPARIGDDLGPFVKFALFGKPYYHNIGSMYDYTARELAEVDEIEQEILRRWGHKLGTTRAAPRIIDVQGRGVNKGDAARKLKAEMGKKILVCVGDANNDLAMMDGADYAFCPADGVIAEHYPNVCPCADGAVADVIYEKIPQILKNQP